MSELCCRLHHLCQELPRFRFPFDVCHLPLDGVYVLFENGEAAHGTDRIVRIGTHTGSGQLRSRLQQHFLIENKDRSIFRKNIGRAILARDDDPFLEQWEHDLTPRDARERYGHLVDTHQQSRTERRVTECIQRTFSFVVCRVDDKRKRLEWEAKLISTVSLCTGCLPSTEWLGRYSPVAKIRDGGLWNVQHLYKEPLSESDYGAFDRECQTFLAHSHDW